jgi:hypothetical protein
VKIPTLENASLTLIQGKTWCLLKRKSKNLDFSRKIDPLGIILCGESIARIPQRFPDLESGNRSVCIEAKIEKF